MQHFKKILVYVDPEAEDAPALRRAEQLAQRNAAQLDVIDVREESPRYLGFLTKKLHVDATLEAIKRDRAARLEALVMAMRSRGCKGTVYTATGTPFLEIIRTVLRRLDRVPGSGRGCAWF